jgi:predicted RNA-binding Zn ribbon-like protein
MSMTPIRTETTQHTVEPAPGRLELVRQFVNSYDAEIDREDFSSPSALARWLRGKGLLGERVAVQESDLEAAIDVREALRSLLLANNGVPIDESAIKRLNRAADEAGLHLTFHEDGDTSVEPSANGVAGALGIVLSRVHASMADGSWQRLKVCPADDCLWAFFDRSRNRSRRWCEMEICGNRAKVRSYRERREHA